ncbi:hypothetical protein Efla_007039 [Eimeria flavescens]
MARLLLIVALPLLLTARATGGLSGAEGEQRVPASSCPAHSGWEHELLYFQNAKTSGATGTSGSLSPEEAADAAKKSGVYVELTQSALQLAFNQQHLGLVLRGDVRCTNTSPLAVAFVSVAKAFARMSLLEPQPLFVKLVPEAGASARTPGMRQGRDEGCEVLLAYKQPNPDGGEDAQNMTLPLPAGSTDEEIKLQIIKYDYALCRHRRVHYSVPIAPPLFFPLADKTMPVPTGVLVAATRVPIIDVFDPSVASLYQVEPLQQLLMFPRGLREVFALDASTEEDQASAQLRLIRALEVKHSAVLPLTIITAPSIFTELRPVAFFFGGAEPSIAEDHAFTEAAAAWGHRMAFCSSIRPSALQTRAVDYLGIRGLSLPQIVIVSKIDNPKLTTKFRCPEISSIVKINQCFTDYADGKLAPYYKTAALPRVQRGPVYELVASRFNAVVLDSAQEVLLLVYSPACPHSAIFMPVFEELALRVANEESLLIARLDGNANEVEGLTVPARSETKAETVENEGDGQPDPVSVHGYPVVVFFAKKDPEKNTKVPIVYTGPRNVDALRNFVISQTALQAHEDL